MSLVTRSFSSLGRVVALSAALGFSAVANAAIISLDFTVEVTTRELHDGLGGFGGFNWVEDTSYGGDLFDLTFQIDTGDLTSRALMFSLDSRAPDIAGAETLLDADIDAVLDRWPSVRGEPSLQVLQEITNPLAPGPIEGNVTFSRRAALYNTPDSFDSTESMIKALTLTASNTPAFVTIEDIVNGYLITEPDIQAVLNDLQASGTSFAFAQSGLQLQGDVYQYLDKTAYIEGVRYFGTATFKATDVPLPATLWLVVAGILATCWPRRRRI